jgi:hypothetical protein
VCSDPVWSGGSVGGGSVRPRRSRAGEQGRAAGARKRGRRCGTWTLTGGSKQRAGPGFK